MVRITLPLAEHIRRVLLEDGLVTGCAGAYYTISLEQRLRNSGWIALLDSEIDRVRKEEGGGGREGPDTRLLPGSPRKR